jgi:hypothetical protein
MVIDHDLQSLRFSGLILAVLIALCPAAAEAYTSTTAVFPKEAWGSHGLHGHHGPRMLATTTVARIATPFRDEPTTEHAPAPPALDTAASYIFQEGNTLWSIGARLGAGTDVILNANNFIPMEGLRPGVTIVVPWSNPAGTAHYKNGSQIVTGSGLHFVASVSQQACWLFRDDEIQEHFFAPRT